MRYLTKSDRLRAGEMPAGYGASIPSGSSAAWTDERVELLRKLWASGLSASRIAARLGGVTRNAVIGKANRLGLSARAEVRGKRGGPRGLAAARKRHVPKIRNLDLVIESRTLSRANEPRPMPIPEPPPLPVSRRLSMADLGPHDCRWIDGDPRGEHTYCGCKAVPGASWCPGHMAIVYPPTRAAGRLMAA